MSEKVLKMNINKEPGYLYYLECSVCSKKKWVRKKCKPGDIHLWDVWRSNTTSGANPKKRNTFYKIARIKKEHGYVYFIDSDGDVSRFKVDKNKS